MAKVLYGAIVTELKGKINGQVFQGGNVGYVLRNKGYTPGISNNLRQFANSNLTAVTTAWRTLSDADRSAWNAIAGSWPFTNKFGTTYYGSGFQVFVAYNTALLTMEYPQVTTPGAPTIPTDPGAVDFNTATTSALAFDIPNTTVNPDVLQLFASRPVSAGTNGNNVAMRLIDQFDYSIASPFSFFTKYTQLYGAYNVGSKIFIKLVARSSVWSYPHFVQYANKIVS